VVKRSCALCWIEKQTGWENASSFSESKYPVSWGSISFQGVAAEVNGQLEVPTVRDLIILTVQMTGDKNVLVCNPSVALKAGGI
jgi:hypothetical protein